MLKKIIISLIFLIPLNIDAKTDISVDVLNMNIIEIQDAVDKGYLDYETIMLIHLERIEKYDSLHNSIRFLNEDALDLAREMDAELKDNGRRSLLHGIPVLIKDNIDVAGMPTTAGARVLSDNMPNYNAEIIDRLIDAGAIVIAKTNMSEFAFSANDSRSSFGHVRNAYNRLYTPYGSSGGTAVGVALGFAPIGIGTDTNSSIRMPASAAALIGLRPTFGSIDMKGVIPYDAERDIAGPITKYAVDAEIVYSIISDYEIENKNIRVGVLTDFFNEFSTSSLNPLRSTYKPIVNMMESVIVDLEGLDYELVEIEGITNSYYENIRRNNLSGFLFCYDFNQYIKNTSGNVRNFSDLMQGGTIYNVSGHNISCNFDSRSTTRMENINNRKDEYTEYILEKMSEYNVDVLIYPTSKNKIFTISSPTTLIGNSAVFSPTTGMPAVTIPIGFDNGLPYGMEIIGKHNEESIILSIAKKLEEINQHYYVPETAPINYNVNEKKVELKEIYEIYFMNEEYELLNERARNVFLSETSDEQIDDLIIDYKNNSVPDYYVTPEIEISFQKTLYSILSAYLLTAFIITIYVVKKRFY